MVAVEARRAPLTLTLSGGSARWRAAPAWGGAPTACAEIDYERDVVAANVGARALGEALARLREPLVVRGGAKAWRASGRWTLETLVRWSE